MSTGSRRAWMMRAFGSARWMKSGEMEVPRHLVGDPLRRRRQRSDRGDIARADLAQLLARHRGNHLGEAERATVEAGKALHDVV